MDAKLRYKAKKIKVIFFDIDDTLRNSKTGFIPTSIPTVFKQLREKGLRLVVGFSVSCQRFASLNLTFLLL